MLEPDERSLSGYRVAFEHMAQNPPASYAFKEARKKVVKDLGKFFSTCCWINSQRNPQQEAQLQLGIPNKAQEIALATIAEIQKRGDPIRIVNPKARQKGMSTFYAEWIMSQLLLYPETSGAVMAHSKEAGEGLFSICWRLFMGMKDRAQLGVTKAKGSAFKRYLELAPMHSSICVLVADEPGRDEIGYTGRSKTFQYLHCSEVPFWRNASATLTALRQCVPRSPNTAIFLESTARSYGDVFHKQWIAAFDKKYATLYVPLFIPWFIDDDYTLIFIDEKAKEDFANSLRDKETADYGNEIRLMEEHPEITLEHLHWRRWKLADELEMNLDIFRREFPSYPDEAFQSTQGNWLSPVIMTRYKQEASKPIAVGDWDNQENAWGRKPKFVERPDGFVRIWRQPRPYHQYVLGTDSAEGNEFGDHSAGIVLCRKPEGVHAEIHGTDYRRPTQTEFAEQVYWTARHYNECWINPESNYGQVIAAMLVNIIGYHNVMRSKDVTVGPGALSRNPGKVGWWKCPIVEQFVQPLSKQWFQGTRSDPQVSLKYCPIEALLDEAMACIVVGNKVQAPNKGLSRRPGSAEEGYYDDRLIAMFGAILADYALTEAPTPDEAEETAEESDLDEMRALMQGDMPGGYFPFTREMPYGWLQQRPSWRRW